ncbi:MAG: superoxide dismutase [Deltaproteobacteria bacterium]|nr:superoxide dismutase [Deltaproteobacteria bacterium]
MHQLPDLPYAFDALEPYIDARTMEIHHDKHHAAYVANVNKALENVTEDALKTMDIVSLMKHLEAVPESVRTAVRNNGGGHCNHSLFWELMSAGKGGTPKGDVAAAIQKEFGAFEAFQEKFETAATTRFGSGWAWLSVKDGRLVVSSTPNQDNPFMDGSGTPILALDVWEHAYYLKYQNRRPEYVKAFWNVVNWNKVADLYAAALK